MKMKIRINCRRGGSEVLVCAVIVFSVLLILLLCLWAFPQYSVWQQGMSGKAELAKAEANRQILIKEAEAQKASATLLAEAEIERAKGVAAANEIIGGSLNDNEAYLHYLWIQGLADAGNVIYVPTEANLPILEAGRFSAMDASKERVERLAQKLLRNSTVESSE